MGCGVLAAYLAGGQQCRGTGDTFGISCVCSEKTFGAGRTGRFLGFYRIFYAADNRRLSGCHGSGDSFGRTVSQMQACKRVFGPGCCDSESHSRGLLCDFSADLGFLQKSFCCHILSHGISCHLHEYFGGHREY